MTRATLTELIKRKIIMHGDLYVINRLSDSKLKVWANGFDEAEDVFRAYYKGKCIEVESIEQIEKDVVRFAI
jgi:hypothetical protein